MVETDNKVVILTQEVEYMVQSIKDLCLGMTEDELDTIFQANWDSLSKQIYSNGVYYQVCLDNGVVVDLYMIT